MKLIKKNKYIIIILLITIALLFRLFTSTRYFGHDTVFHISNIIELSKTISIEKIFGSKIVTFGSNQYGYGTGFFYPRLPHTLGAYLYLIFNNVYTSMNIVYLITTFLSGVAMFYLSKKIFNNKMVALLSAVIYLAVPYHICEIYIRDAYAENFMFLASPLIFLGLYYLKDDDYKHFYINFILGYVIGMYSHLVTMVFCTIFVAIFIIYHHKNFLKKEKIKALIISALIVIGLTIPFLTTVIEYKLTDIYTVFVNQAFANREGVLNRTIELKEYIIQEPLWDKIQSYFNYSTIILFIITTIKLIFNKTKYKKELMPLILMIILLLNLISSKLLWEYIPEFFVMIQFSWRLLVFLSLFIALYAPVCLLSNINMNKLMKKIVYCLIIFLVFIEGLNNIQYYGNEQLTEENATNSRSAMGFSLEYLPNQTLQIVDSKYFYHTYVKLREPGIFKSDENVEIEITEESFPNLTFEIDKIEEEVTLELPRVYYLGYKLKDEDGNNIELYMNDRGFLGANIKENGKYILTHSKTTIEKIADTIGLVTIIICIFALMRCKKWIIKK